MSNWKYTDATHTVVFRTHDNGMMESMLLSALHAQIDAETPEDETPVYPEIEAEDGA